jgi:hypothetical protein
VNASDPAEATRIREEIVRGFYGGNRMPRFSWRNLGDNARRRVDSNL